MSNIDQNWRGAHIRVLIADHHAAYLYGLRWLAQALFDLVGEAHDGAETLSKTLLLRPDVVVLNASMPKMDGIMAVRRIKDDLPNTGIVVTSDSEDESVVMNAAMAGANSYLPKEASWRCLAKAIRYGAAGKSLLLPSVAKHMLAAMEAARLDRARADLEWTPLTALQMAVLRMTSEGRTFNRIAADLGISQCKLSDIVSQIHCSIFIADRHEALVQAIKCGLIQV